jgi:ribosomal protein S18 acetylase RimI-like enzyme
MQEHVAETVPRFGEMNTRDNGMGGAAPPTPDRRCRRRPSAAASVMATAHERATSRSSPDPDPVLASLPRVEIQRIGPADWERFREIRLASLSESPEAFGSRYAHWVDAPAERWQSRLSQVELTLVAHEGQTPVGVVSGQLVGEEWVELISMWVSPEHRGAGVAGQLIDAVVAWAARRGRDTHLMVRRDNVPARRCYERAGFVDTGMPEGWPAGEPPEHRMERRRSR